MANSQRSACALLVFVMCQIILSAIHIQAKMIKFNEEQTFKNLMFASESERLNIIDGLLSFGGTANRECLNELKAIKNGLKSREKWAVKFMDAQGRFPSGVLHGNHHDLGSYPECFHIDRNGKPYRTQYCVINAVMKDPSIDDIQKILDDGSVVSLGVCLPASCETQHLLNAINLANVINGNSLIVGFKNILCQFEEKATDWRTIDFVAIGVFGVLLLLMVLSTAYDIIYTIYNRTRDPPLIVFSMFTNGKKLFACPPPTSSTIQCLDGLRVMSIMWIVYNHAYRRYGFIPLREQTTYDEYTESYHSALSNAPMPVNTFLALSGLLVANKMFKLLKKDGKLDVLSLYWNRYLRLTPAYGAIILFTISVLRYCGDGPIWSDLYEARAKTCEKYWWSSLLYVQNYVNPDDLCLIPTWYLAVDTQLFIIAPLLVYLIHRSKKTTFTALFILILGGIGYTIYLYIENNITVAFYFLYYKVYYPTQTRFPAWLIGFITGYILFRFPKGSIHIPRIVNVCAWTIALIVMPIIVFANYPFNLSTPIATPLQYGLTEPLSHAIWSIAVCYIIFACRYDSGGPVNWFLSLSFWQPLSKLSYMIYLNHYIMLLAAFYSIEAPQYFSELLAFRNFVSIFVLATLLAIPMTLAFELPIDAINRLTNGSSKPKNQQNNNNTTIDKSNDTQL